MTNKHTPGQWKYAHREVNGMYSTQVFSDEYGRIAICDWVPKYLGRGVTATYREANARLMAAAPDLLDALICLKDWVELEVGCELPHDIIDEAIAKATGEKIENIRRY